MLLHLLLLLFLFLLLLLLILLSPSPSSSFPSSSFSCFFSHLFGSSSTDESCLHVLLCPEIWKLLNPPFHFLCWKKIVFVLKKNDAKVLKPRACQSGNEKIIKINHLHPLPIPLPSHHKVNNNSTPFLFPTKNHPSEILSKTPFFLCNPTMTKNLNYYFALEPDVPAPSPLPYRLEP